MHLYQALLADNLSPNQVDSAYKLAKMGPLPEPWWGMADGWRIHEGRHQIWIANGVAQDGTLLPASAYADETTGGFVYPVEVAQLLRQADHDAVTVRG
jgi:hypothetical protein